MRRPWLLGPALLLACDAPAAPAPAAATPPPPPAEPTAPVAPPPKLHPVTVVAPDAGLHVAAYRNGELSLHLLGDDVFVSGSGDLARADASGQLVHLEHALTGQARSTWRFDYWRVLAFGGRWPGDAWLVTEYVAGRTNSPPHVHRRVGDEWRAAVTKDRMLYWYYEAVIPWHSGQVLGLRTYTTDPEIRMDLETPKKTRKAMYAQLATTHRGFDVLGDTPSATTMQLDKRLAQVIAVAAAPTGEVFVLGSASDDLDSPRFVQRWSLAGVSTVDTMPDRTECESLSVRAADEVYVGCVQRHEGNYTGVVRRFDGATWTADPVPPNQGIVRVAVAPSGDLWALAYPDDQTGKSPQELWHRAARPAQWQRTSLPALRFVDAPGDPPGERITPVLPTELLARGPDDVWIVARTDLNTRVGETSTTREVVLRSRPSGEPLRMRDDAELARAVSQ